MSGTKSGGKQTAETNKKRYGSDFYIKLGVNGGKNGTGHKFAHGKVDPGEVGKLGGRPVGWRFPKKYHHKKT